MSGVPQVFIASFLNLVRTSWPISKLLPLPHFPPNSSLHQAAREARNKAREVEGPPWAWAGLWQGSGWVMPLTWWFGGSMYNREFTGIRWSLTSVPICNDFLPPALGNTASAQFPGPQRKARFHRRDPNLTQGEACRIYLWRLPTQHIRIFIQSTFLPNLVGAQQTQYCKTGYSELCFLLNLKSSFITLLIPDRRKRPSPILFTLCSRQSPLGQVSTEMLGRWPVHIAYHGRRPALRLPSTRRKYSLLGCWRNWQLMETKPWVTRMCTRP